MGDNGKEKLSGGEKPILETGGTQEPKLEGKSEPEKPTTDFKVAEIWIRSGQVMLDATPNFWQDRCRALGLLELCKDIVKTAKSPEPQKSKIISVKNGFLNGIRNLKLRRK